MPSCQFEGEDVRRGALRDTRAMSFIGGKPQPTDIGMESFEMLKVFRFSLQYNSQSFPYLDL